MAFVSPDRKEELMDRVMMAVACTRIVARDYLVGANWDEAQAIVNYRIDASNALRYASRAQYMPRNNESKL